MAILAPKRRGINMQEIRILAFIANYPELWKEFQEIQHDWYWASTRRGFSTPEISDSCRKLLNEVKRVYNNDPIFWHALRAYYEDKTGWKADPDNAFQQDMTDSHKRIIANAIAMYEDGLSTFSEFVQTLNTVAGKVGPDDQPPAPCAPGGVVWLLDYAA
jgi:hypothetical protein